jgi:hypothetical protein
VFSYVDLVRVEIALEVGERFGVAIPASFLKPGVFDAPAGRDRL